MTNQVHAESRQQRFEPPYLAPDGAPESQDVWGFADTTFRVNEQGHTEVTGSRYAGLSGEQLPSLIPWFRDIVGLPFDPADRNPSGYPTAIPDPVPAPGFLDELKATFAADQVSLEPAVRLRHGHGHTQAEMFAIKYGRLPRIPDLVVYPADHDQVVWLVEAARRHGVALIPFGGGTNVTEALVCPPEERRAIVSVDLRRLHKVLWIDPENRMACIEAGATGRHITAQLARYGFMLGHEPDSLEFSTLGGWIATHASGMKKNRYGNIEDLVLDMTVVSAQGVLSRPAVAPRESIGLDPKRMVLGSEGNLGIVTQAVVKLFPLPEVQNYGSVLFRDFSAGVAFMHDLAKTGRLPASVRLVDNVQFQFGIALKPASQGLAKLKSRLEKWFVTGVLGFEPNRMVALTLVFEGAKAEVAEQEALVYALAKRHGGMKAGPGNGHRGYQLTFAIAYIRDFIMGHYFLAESFETSVPWSQVETLCREVKARIAREHAAHGLPGKPFVSCRVTQAYHTGACVYFYYALNYKGLADPSGVYHAIEVAARDEVLKQGGSLSHHHGIGKLRQDFLPAVFSEGALAWRQATKQALDPTNVFAAANGVSAPAGPEAP